MDVELPDGTVIEGVPDGMSRSDLIARLKKNGYDVSKLEQKAQAQEAVQVTASNAECNVGAFQNPRVSVHHGPGRSRSEHAVRDGSKASL